jgi:hypothetical protein
MGEKRRHENFFSKNQKEEAQDSQQTDGLDRIGQQKLDLAGLYSGAVWLTKVTLAFSSSSTFAEKGVVGTWL